MTFGELKTQLEGLNSEQLNSDVAVELGVSEEVFGSDSGIQLLICDTEHGTLDTDHPVIYVKYA